LTSVPSLLETEFTDKDTLYKVIDRLEKEVNEPTSDVLSTDENSMDVDERGEVDGVLSEVEADTVLPMDRDLTPQLLRKENDEYLEFDQEEINQRSIDPSLVFFGPNSESFYDNARISSHQSVDSNASTIIPGPTNFNASDSSEYYEPTNDPFSPLVKYSLPVDIDQSGQVYSTVVNAVKAPLLAEHLRPVTATAVSGAAQLPKLRADCPKL